MIEKQKQTNEENYRLKQELQNTYLQYEQQGEELRKKDEKKEDDMIQMDQKNRRLKQELEEIYLKYKQQQLKLNFEQRKKDEKQGAELNMKEDDLNKVKNADMIDQSLNMCQAENIKFKEQLEEARIKEKQYQESINDLREKLEQAKKDLDQYNSNKAELRRTEQQIDCTKLGVQDKNC